MLRSSLIDALAFLDRDISNIPRRSIEKNVDLLKGKSLSLWQEEVDEEDRGGRETGEYEVCSVPTNESAMLPGSLS